MSISYTIKDLEDLLKEVKYRYGLSEEEICEKVGVNPTYISQCRSRKKVSSKFYLNVKEEFPELKNSENDEVVISVLISYVAELLAWKNKTSVSVERAIIEKDVEYLKSRFS